MMSDVRDDRIDGGQLNRLEAGPELINKTGVPTLETTKE